MHQLDQVSNVPQIPQPAEQVDEKLSHETRDLGGNTGGLTGLLHTLTSGKVNLTTLDIHFLHI